MKHYLIAVGIFFTRCFALLLFSVYQHLRSLQCRKKLLFRRKNLIPTLKSILIAFFGGINPKYKAWTQSNKLVKLNDLSAFQEIYCKITNIWVLLHYCIRKKMVHKQDKSKLSKLLLLLLLLYVLYFIWLKQAVGENGTQVLFCKNCGEHNYNDKRKSTHSV